MSQPTATTIPHPKHDIHKFRDIKLKLSKENWMSWKRELLATARDRGLHTIITGTNPYPDTTNPTVTLIGGVEMIGC
jgi:hypothetical protein